MTTKDWQSVVEAAIQKECEAWACWKELSEQEQTEVFNGYYKIASIVGEKLEAYYSLPKVPQTEAVREENKRVIELENKIAILESRASQFESTIKATLAREEWLVKALEAISKPPYKTDENGLIAAAHIRGDIARAALKAWRGET